MKVDLRKIKCTYKWKYDEFGYKETQDCEQFDCPFYIAENDSGYYPCCLKDDFIKKYKKLERKQDVNK